MAAAAGSSEEPNSESRNTRGSRPSTRPPRCKIELLEVFGNTVTNSNAFDTISDRTFAVCSGSTAVVNSIAPDLTIIQRSFRAPTKLFKDAVPTVNSTPNSPSRTKGKQALRASLLPSGSGASEIKNKFSKTAVHRKPKGTSCLALSQNGLFLAVGEIGYAPRILLFSLTSGSNIPDSIATEHDCGIQSLCFSPDSKWLCSVGDAHDGYIHIWQITSKNRLKLCTSSRCISFVNQAKWISDKSIVTAGVRHLKIWKPEIRDQASSPSRPTFTPKTRARPASPVPANPTVKSLPGRNVLIDDLLETVFTALCRIDDSTALVGAESGNLSVFNLDLGTQTLTSVTEIGAPIRCITYNSEKNVILAATNLDIWISIPPGTKPDLKWNLSHFVKGYHLTSCALAIGFVTEHQVICIDDRRRASLYRLQVDSGNYRAFNFQLEKTYPTHPGSVNGSILRTEKSESTFLTYDASGHLVKRDSGITEYDIPVLAHPSTSNLDADNNELRVMKQTVRTGSTICGDKHGSVFVFDDGWTFCDRQQAHSGEINDIAVIEVQDLDTLIVTCGRDRVVQVFSMPLSKLKLEQTIAQHTGSVNKLEVVKQSATLLLSLSSDRTIVVHVLSKVEQSQAFLVMTTISMKSTPLSCALDPAGQSYLLVTTSDKQLQTFDLTTGSLESNMRTIDEDDQIAIQHMQIRSTVIDDKSVVLVIGVSNKDKALRVHNGNTGEMMCKAGGHSEIITSVTILEEETQARGGVDMRIATTSIEGTVMFWKLWFYSPWDLDPIDTSNPATPKGIKRSPLHKVLSKTQLASFANALNLSSWSASPSPSREHPQSRKGSPHRLRSPLSLASLSGGSPRNSRSHLWGEPAARALNLPLPTMTPKGYKKISRIPTRSTSGGTNLNVDYDLPMYKTTNQLISLLREFRTCRSRPSGALNSGTLQVLQQELEMTLNVLGNQDRPTTDSSPEKETNDSSFEQTDDDSTVGQDRDGSRQDSSYHSAVDTVQSGTIAEE